VKYINHSGIYAGNVKITAVSEIYDTRVGVHLGNNTLVEIDPDNFGIKMHVLYTHVTAGGNCHVQKGGNIGLEIQFSEISPQINQVHVNK